MIILITFLLITIALAEELSDQYFGVPIGQFKFTKLGIRGDIYVADEHTFVLDKFTHMPRLAGCTAVMVGPARDEDQEKKVGPGILLPYSQPNFAWEEIRRHKERVKRELTGERMNKNSRGASSDRLRFYGNVHNIELSTTINPEDSYEEIEYVEDEEEVIEKEVNLNHLEPEHVQDGETQHKSIKAVPTTRSIFPTLITESPFISALSEQRRVIIFDKRREKLGSTAQNDENKWPIPKKKEIVKQVVENRNETKAPISAQAFKRTLFSLPPARNDLASFLLTNGARITDYKWIGLYDQCNNKSEPLVWLADVDPPREENISPMIGLHRNISSGVVRILNCNTLLVPHLFFIPKQELPNTFFHVGVGDILDISQQTKVRIIGYEIDDPLERHLGDDVMVRLPHGIRTFDIDFLSIYNEDERITYAYVNLPSVLVPPCVDSN